MIIDHKTVATLRERERERESSNLNNKIIIINKNITRLSLSNKIDF